MGVDAHITVKQVKEGHHILNDYMPVFKVTESAVAIIPCWMFRFGGVKSLIPELDHWTVEFLFDNNLGGITVVELNGADFGVLVLSMDSLRQFFGDVVDEWERKRVGPGEVNWDTLLAAWGKITPGHWAITRYYVSGSNERWFSWHPPQGVELETEEVEWKIWT